MAITREVTGNTDDDDDNAASAGRFDRFVLRPCFCFNIAWLHVWVVVVVCFFGECMFENSWLFGNAMLLCCVLLLILLCVVVWVFAFC